jgi:peptidyl-prolyl cis-trans isomerase SurA
LWGGRIVAGTDGQRGRRSRAASRWRRNSSRSPAADASGQLNIPANVQIFGKSDPNVRRATAIVNGEILTGTDIDQRLALIINANGGKVSAEEQERLRLQVLRNLIDETLDPGSQVGGDVDDDEVDQTYERVAKQNFGQDPAALDKYLTSIGSSPASLKRQIRGELSWQRLLRRNVQPYINISDGEVREMIERLKASKGTEEYRIGEIYLSANDQNRSQVMANANQIVEQLKKGGSFVAYARQYSEASTAAVGGDLAGSAWPSCRRIWPTWQTRCSRASWPGRSRFPAAIRSST